MLQEPKVPAQVFYGDEFHGTTIIGSNLGGTSGNNNIIYNTPASGTQAFKGSICFIYHYEARSHDQTTDVIAKDAVGQNSNVDSEAARRAWLQRFPPESSKPSAQNPAGSATYSKKAK
jgi:hypothetical protein